MESDARFKHMLADPKFRRIPRKERKVQIDKRFEAMFKDARFKVKCSVDKRGRPVSFASSENLKRYYDLSSSGESSDSESDASNEEEEEDKEQKSKQKLKKEKTLKAKPVEGSSSEESSSEESNDEEESESLKTNKTKKVDLVEKSRNKKNAKEDSSLKKEEKDKIKDNKKKALKKKPEDDLESEEEDSSNEDENAVPVVEEEEAKTVSNKVRNKLKNLSVDYARGGGNLHSESSSSSDEETGESSEDGSNGEEVEHNWGELDKDAERTDETTSRLALCNMDWERVKSDDLMVLLSSFLPATGAITKISIYPSELGLKCMKEEEQTGPRELAEQPILEDEEDDGAEQFDVEKLRQYEMRRLSYYYAVVTCDTVKTAAHLYEECDGLEYESTAARLDLRFIPDDTTFDHEPRDECTSVPPPDKYTPLYFSSGALTQAKFEFTWDETDPRRAALSQKLWASKNKELDDGDLKGVLATSSSEESDQEGSDAGARYRALLDDSGKKDKGEELQVSWGIDLQAKTDQKAAESRRKAAGLGELTPFEELMKKKREKSKEKKLQRLQKLQKKESDDEEGGKPTFSDDELPSDLEDLKMELSNAGTSSNKDKKGKKGKRGKKKHTDDQDEDPQQKAELELLLMDEEGEDRHFNFDTRKPGKQKIQEDDFEVDVKDPRFGALYSSHHYNLDPADPHFRTTKGTKAFVSEKIRRRNANDEEDMKGGKKSKKNIEKNPGVSRTKDAELSQLVRSVKRKTEMNLANKAAKKKNRH